MKIGGLFSNKIKRGLLGRKQSLNIVQKLFSKNDKVIWMHAASLGEYEQGLPVLTKLKEKFPNFKILITFFSPSGYENVINKNHIADCIVYLPFDKKSLVKEFTSSFTTKIFFTVKYDYWYNLLEELKNQGAKTYVISALFYEKQVFFKSFGSFFRDELNKNIDWFFHQTEKSFSLAKSIGLDKSFISGDTRFDRVKEFQSRDNFVEFISEFKQEKTLLVFGSSWEAEEKIAEIISQKINSIKIILAPHDISRAEKIQKKFPNSVLYSELESNQLSIINHQLLIIDSIGLLSKLYSYADLAIVGGGFHSSGLHNILEAATFGIPVFFGNHYKKNPEADGLIAANGAKSFENETETAGFLINSLNEDSKDNLVQMGKNAEQFINNQPNASQIIIKKIGESLS
jgi:3-deoxy-D-manno-octulosonic-acid transferase